MDPHFGKKLAQARQARSLSIEEAARATRIRSAYLQALEDGNLVKFPNAAYAKSFLLMYGRFLGVNVQEAAGEIDTATQMRVEDFQYLSNRVDKEKRLKRDATDTKYDFVVPRETTGSWRPLFILGGIAGVLLLAFTIWSTVQRFDDSLVAPTPPPTAAIEPLKAGEPVVALEPPRAVVVEQPAAAVEAPRAVVVAPSEKLQPLDPALPPVEIPRAKPISPIATLASQDSALLADLPTPPPPAPPASPSFTPEHALSPDPVETEVASEPPPEPDMVILEPQEKTWVVIRNGPGGQPLYEDYLYPSARAMRLPPGRYFIELKKADAVEITKNGRRIAYSSPGVLVQ